MFLFFFGSLDTLRCWKLNFPFLLLLLFGTPETWKILPVQDRLLFLTNILRLMSIIFFNFFFLLILTLKISLFLNVDPLLLLFLLITITLKAKFQFCFLSFSMGVPAVLTQLNTFIKN